jgi:hypothetical protein
MRKKIGFLKSATAAVDGYYSKKGEKLVAGRLTQEQVNEFNGKKKKVKAEAAPKKVVAPTVAEVEVATEVAAAEVFASIAETEKTD